MLGCAGAGGWRRFAAESATSSLRRYIFLKKGKHVSYIQFLGAAGTVTGSKHLIHAIPAAAQAALRRCSIAVCFRGPRSGGSRTGRIRRCRRARSMPWCSPMRTWTTADGFPGWWPKATAGTFTPRRRRSILCGILLPDSGYLQEEDAAFHNKQKSSKHDPALPLYTLEQARASLAQFSPIEFGKSRAARPGNRLPFRALGAHPRGGHDGSDTHGNGGQRVCLFTGDIGRVRDSADRARQGRAFRTDGGRVARRAGDGVHLRQPRAPARRSPAANWRSSIRDTVKRGGSVIVPSFAVERTQKFLFLLKKLMEDGQIPRVPVSCRLADGDRGGQNLSQALGGVQRRDRGS